MRQSRVRIPEHLSDRHDVERFHCGHPDLDAWLQRQARASEARSARTYVVAVGGRVVGYYCLAAGSVARADLPSASLRRDLPGHVPMIILGRLAVDAEFAGQRIGAGLVKDALLRCLTAADAIGVRALLVHAIDQRAAAFYRRLGFVPFAGDALTLVLPLETAAALLGGA